MPISAATTALIDAAQTAVDNVAAASPTGLIADATLLQVRTAVTAAIVAYNAILAEQQLMEGAILGINLDALTQTSVLDNFAIFAAEFSNIMNDSDLTTALGYMGRIVANLTLAGG